MTVRIKDNSPAIRKAILRGIKGALGDMADKWVERAVMRVGVDTGDLGRDIRRGKVEKTHFGFEVEMGSYAAHSAVAEFGSAIRGEPIGSSYRSPVGAEDDWPDIPPGKKTFQKYKIVPKNKKYLRWKDEDGNVHFAKEVWHPGRHAAPYARPSVDELRLVYAGPIIRRRIQKELDKVG